MKRILWYIVSTIVSLSFIFIAVHDLQHESKIFESSEIFYAVLFSVTGVIIAINIALAVKK